MSIGRAKYQICMYTNTCCLCELVFYRFSSFYVYDPLVPGRINITVFMTLVCSARVRSSAMKIVYSSRSLARDATYRSSISLRSNILFYFYLLLQYAFFATSIFLYFPPQLFTVDQCIVLNRLLLYIYSGYRNDSVAAMFIQENPSTKATRYRFCHSN